MQILCSPKTQPISPKRSMGNRLVSPVCGVQGVWADPVSKDVAQVFQAWAVLEQRHGTIQLARELFKCAVKADPQSQISWAVSYYTNIHALLAATPLCPQNQSCKSLQHPP